jgi:hypothetical protein
MIMELLQNAWDAHVHCGPDIVERPQNFLQYGRDVAAAGMAGVVLKDHCGSTQGAASVLGDLYPEGARFLGSLTLNRPVGGINPVAVEAALLAGVRIIFLPSQWARNHLEVSPEMSFATRFDRVLDAPEPGIVVAEGNRVRPEMLRVLDLLAERDGVLCSSHISADEAIAVFRAGRQRGLHRMVLTHSSLPWPGATLDTQRRVAEMGVWIEHSVLALSPAMPDPIAPVDFIKGLRAVGPERVILSSDLGQSVNGPAVRAFADQLGRLQEAGLTDVELDLMIRKNPRRLLEE